jgi:hypothetical protein
MGIEGFWSKAPEYGRSRELDPLGLSTVHEAAADVLLPFLSGRTWTAEDYLWVLVGLRWAGEHASTEGEIWEYFEVFEKALKLNWYHRGRRQGFTGVDAVRDHYNAGRTDLLFKLVSNQRSQGLLGAYLRSLREGGLVERRSLRLADPGRALIGGIMFRWSGEISGYGWLAHAFDRAQQGFGRIVLRELGAALFDPEPMRDVAMAIRSLGAGPAWRTAAPRLASSNGKQIVAGIGNDLARFSKRVTQAFWVILESPGRAVARLEAAGLSSRGWRDVVFRSNGLQPLREPFDRFLLDAQRRPKHALVDLHGAIWDQRGHTVPWIRISKGSILVRPDVALKAPPAEGEWDLRWNVAHELVRQTGWRPS